MPSERPCAPPSWPGPLPGLPLFQLVLLLRSYCPLSVRPPQFGDVYSKPFEASDQLRPRTSVVMPYSCMSCGSRSKLSCWISYSPMRPTLNVPHVAFVRPIVAWRSNRPPDKAPDIELKPDSSVKIACVPPPRSS